MRLYAVERLLHTAVAVPAMLTPVNIELVMQALEGTQLMFGKVYSLRVRLFVSELSFL